MIDLKILAIAKKIIGSPTDEQVSTAVTNYLDENPVEAYDDTEITQDISQLKSDIAKLENELSEITYETYTNQPNATAGANVFAVWFTEEVNVKSIRPMFVDNASGTFVYRFASAASPIRAGDTISLGELKTAAIGDAIEINKRMDNTMALIVYSQDYKLKYTNGAAAAELQAAGLVGINPNVRPFDAAVNSVPVSQALSGSYAFASEIVLQNATSNIHTRDEIESIAKGMIDDSIDASLSVAGMTADAKEVGDRLAQISDNLEGSLYTTVEETATNAEQTSNTSKLGYFTLYFDEPTKVQTVDPVFSVNTGTYTWRVVTSAVPFGAGVTVEKGAAHTENIGTPVVLNGMELSNTRGIEIHGNGDAVLKYVAKKMAARMFRTEENKYVISQFTELNNASMAFNTLVTTRQEYAIYTKSEADERFMPIGGVVQADFNYLVGKKLMVVGDSMVKGHSLSNDKTCFYRLCQRNGMTYDNRGTNGAFMSDRQYNSVDNSVYQKICVSGSPMYITDADMADVDYILIFAGTNDCAANVTIGDVDSSNVTEFCGALNAICDTLQTRRPTARIAFISPYLRIGTEARARTFIDAIKSVCGKYSIPVFDNGANGSIRWRNNAMVEALTLQDSYHLNEAGMEFVSYKYEQFLRSI